MAIKLNKVVLKPEKADVILCNPQPNVYLKTAEETVRLGLHHLLSASQFFPVLHRKCFGQHRYTNLCLKKDPEMAGKKEYSNVINVLFAGSATVLSRRIQALLCFPSLVAEPIFNLKK